MKTSNKGIAEIIAHEAIVLSPYLDSVGVWTIGIGHTARAGLPDPAIYRGQKLDMEDVIVIFRRDLAKFEARVRKAFTKPLKQHEFDAAVSFDYNTGAIHRATWVKSFNAGDRAGAISQIMNWRKPKEIIGRRKKEQALFADGTYSSDGSAMVYPATGDGRVQWNQGKRVNVAALLGKAPEDDDPKPDPVKDVIDDAAADGRTSTTEVTSILVGAGGTATAVKETVDAVNDTSITLMDAGPWVLVAVLIACFAGYIWIERRRKRKDAKAALAVMP